MARLLSSLQGTLMSKKCYMLHDTSLGTLSVFDPDTEVNQFLGQLTTILTREVSAIAPRDKKRMSQLLEKNFDVFTSCRGG